MMAGMKIYLLIWAVAAAVISASDEVNDDEDFQDENEDGSGDLNGSGAEAPAQNASSRLLPSNADSVGFCSCCLVTSVLISCLAAFHF
ncbi:uncharacterized protein V6R79_011428 [Siganus canaliculatus]